MTAQQEAAGLLSRAHSLTSGGEGQMKNSLDNARISNELKPV